MLKDVATATSLSIELIILSMWILLMFVCLFSWGGREAQLAEKAKEGKVAAEGGSA